MPDDAHRPSDSDADAPQKNEGETPEPVDMLAPLFREEPLRPEGGEAPPIWLWMIIFGVILFSTYYLGSYIGDFSSDPWLQGRDVVATVDEDVERVVDGSRIYNNRCQTCHQADGQGVAGAFPPLVGTDWVTGDEGRLIRILLHGMEGPMEVLGETYNGVMPGWQRQLDDAEIAAVLTHIRGEWGNDASEITAEQVNVLREYESDRTVAWRADELNAPENQGFPESDDTDEEEETVADEE